MKKQNTLYAFYAKCGALALPFLLLIAFYVYEDPFMVIRSYNDYDHCPIEQSEGDIGWKKMLRNRASQRYDSFIMGSSCTKAYNTEEWNKHIHGRPFRLFANDEALGDLCQKLRAIDKLPHQPVKNLLIIAERRSFDKAYPQPGLIHIMPPDVTGKGLMSYQSTYLQNFLCPKVLLPYLRFRLTGQCDTTQSGIINWHGPTRTALTNDAILYQEKDISAKGEDYWRQPYWRKAIERRTDIHTSPRVIGTEQRRLLKEISDFCKRHATRLKLVIGPSFRRESLHPDDLTALRTILGDSVVYDFTTHGPFMDHHNFYDPEHYRQHVGTEIMEIIYR